MALPNLFYGPHDGTMRGASPTALAVGDSWFWYPFDNLLGEIARQRPLQSIVVAGYNGSESSEWDTKYARSIDTTFDMFARGPLVKALLLSGGGNDIVGTTNFRKLVKADCSPCNTVQSCYAPGEPDAVLNAIAGHYRKLIAKFRSFNANAVVVMHNYDDAYPTGDGVFGPANWLKAPMDRCQIPDDLRRPLFKDLVARLLRMQEDVAAELSSGPVRTLKTSGTLSEDAWANELHPTPAGFRLLAQVRFLPELDAIWGLPDE
ncbi:GDSL-type esterase/lipase family protein [Variovorax sp. RHLX14]|uniref:GDSL-type esterase/lipase family protein n=1 Tax=Variovorax sp. RHLX14 TaxID=1259731 RepID=UPI003F472C29